MKYLLHFYYLFLLFLFSSPLSADNFYIDGSPAQVTIDTSGGETRPKMLDLRVGYVKSMHQFELAIMTSVSDDELNQLTVDVPSAVSVLYHYLPFVDSDIQLHLIVGASQIEVDSSYPGTADSSDSFQGVSFGIGFEESFSAMPQLKMSADWIRLYHGDEMNITAFSLGVHYDF